MSNKALTELPIILSIDSEHDLLYIVDVSDTTESAGGTSKKIIVKNLIKSGETLTSIETFEVSGTNLRIVYKNENSQNVTKTIPLSQIIGSVVINEITLNGYTLNIKQGSSTIPISLEPLFAVKSKFKIVTNLYNCKDEVEVMLTTNGTSSTFFPINKYTHIVDYQDFLNITNLRMNLSINNTPISQHTRFNVRLNHKIVLHKQEAITWSTTGIGSQFFQEIKSILSRDIDVELSIDDFDLDTPYLPTPKFTYLGCSAKLISAIVDQQQFINLQNATNVWESILADPLQQQIEDYYKRKFDIYFDSFTDSSWKYLPELRVELCMLKRYGKNGGHSVNSTKNVVTNPNNKGLYGLRDGFNKAIVHPRHIPPGSLVSTTFNTIYSGGNAGEHPTEWNIESDFLQEQNLNSPFSNKNKNSNIRIELDLLGFIRFRDPSTLTNPKPLLPYYYLAANGAGISNILQSPSCKFKNTGEVKPDKLRTLTFYFRLSAADPTSYNKTKNRYDKRIYSDLSLPIKIQLHSYLDTNDSIRKFSGRLGVKI